MTHPRLTEIVPMPTGNDRRPQRKGQRMRQSKRTSDTRESKPTPTDTATLTIEEVGRHLRRSKAWAYHAAKDGRIPTIETIAGRRVRRMDFERLVGRRAKGGTARSSRIHFEALKSTKRKAGRKSSTSGSKRAAVEGKQVRPERYARGNSPTPRPAAR